MQKAAPEFGGGFQFSLSAHAHHAGNRFLAHMHLHPALSGAAVVDALYAAASDALHRVFTAEAHDRQSVLHHPEALPVQERTDGPHDTCMRTSLVEAAQDFRVRDVGLELHVVEHDHEREAALSEERDVLGGLVVRIKEIDLQRLEQMHDRILGRGEDVVRGATIAEKRVRKP